MHRKIRREMHSGIHRKTQGRDCLKIDNPILTTERQHIDTWENLQSA
ncbi:MAG: hypothetical protein NC416_10310 [Eubacterium sp.]|nr:hypothetical protein [Eubacterium sp.]